VFKAHRRVYHSTVDLRVIKKKKTCHAAVEQLEAHSRVVRHHEKALLVS